MVLKAVLICWMLCTKFHLHAVTLVLILISRRCMVLSKPGKHVLHMSLVHSEPRLSSVTLKKSAVNSKTSYFGHRQHPTFHQTAHMGISIATPVENLVFHFPYCWDTFFIS